MKYLSIPIEHKNEAIRLFEKLGYMEDTEWNELSKSHDKTHILTNEGTWGFFNHKGRVNTPITIEELRELAGEPTPDKLDLLIQQMRELRAELREFMKEEKPSEVCDEDTETAKPSEVREWKVGDMVRIIKEGSHAFSVGDKVELIKYINDSKDIPWLAKSQSGSSWWISESEAEII